MSHTEISILNVSYRNFIPNVPYWNFHTECPIPKFPYWMSHTELSILNVPYRNFHTECPIPNFYTKCLILKLHTKCPIPKFPYQCPYPSTRELTCSTAIAEIGLHFWVELIRFGINSEANLWQKWLKNFLLQDNASLTTGIVLCKYDCISIT